MINQILKTDERCEKIDKRLPERGDALEIGLRFQGDRIHVD
jgi:hypothetical protein